MTIGFWKCIYRNVLVRSCVSQHELFRNIYVIDVNFVLDVLGHAGRTRNLNSDTNIVRKEMSHRSPDTSAARPPAASHKASPGTQTHTIFYLTLLVNSDEHWLEDQGLEKYL